MPELGELPWIDAREWHPVGRSIYCNLYFLALLDLQLIRYVCSRVKGSKHLQIVIQVDPGKPGSEVSKGEETTSQRKNLPIECAQGDQPVRCPNPGFCVHQSSAVPFGGGVFVVACCVSVCGEAWWDVEMWCDVVTSGEMWYLPRKVLQPYCKVLISTTKYYSALQTTTKHHSVLQSATPYRKLLQSITLYYKEVLCTRKYFSVVQSTTK